MGSVRKLALIAALVLCGCESTREAKLPPATLDELTASRMEQFDSEQDFLRYLRGVRAVARQHHMWWSQGAGVQYAQNAADEPCPPELAPCPPEDSIVVSGSRASMSSSQSQSATPTITNVQTQGVDEGDIVKLIGQFLIVLQDGRLFVADTRPADGSGLRLVDRANVYRRQNDTWYDEMLVYQNRIVVTGYSYDENATEIDVFSLSGSGLLTRESSYYLSSNDYYDIENYASRLVGDQLVIYSPIYLSNVDPDRPMQWPLIRTWLRHDDDESVLTKGTRLFNAQDIYRPVQPTMQPAIHTISVCPLGSVSAGDELECRTTSLVGPRQHEFYIAGEAAYLWLTQDDDEREEIEWEEGDDDKPCPPNFSARFEHGPPSGLFQIPLNGDAPKVMLTRGMPADQFALASTDREFRALLRWGEGVCEEDMDQVLLKYFSAPLDAFRSTPTPPVSYRYVDAPSPGADHYENRFTDDYVVYGGRTSWGTYPPFRATEPQTARLIAIPVRQPYNASVMQLPHNVIRVERVGDNAVVTGYRTALGLSISLLDLSAVPHLADTAVLARRFESEGRSHAFNSMIEADGGGLMGLPTVEQKDESGRWWWRSASSDVSFLSLDANGRLNSLGPLAVHENATHPSYDCEVSCIDWYGNSRPIFIDGRIYALMGTELVEGAVGEGRIQERRRLNLSAPPPKR